MKNNPTQLLQLLPPGIVVVFLAAACYFFYTKYVRPSAALIIYLEKVAATVRTMSEGDESMRKSGVAKVFMNTPLESVWLEFAKTLHTQTMPGLSSKRSGRSRSTVPVSHCFSTYAVIDRPLAVDYFKHLPGILTGVGIIGTFGGLLFGLSNFDVSSPDRITRSVGLLLSGVRDAFFASAAAITVAMVITHLEKIQYRRCVEALDKLVESMNGLFESGVGEEYLATLVRHSANSTDHAKSLRDELLQAMVPVIKQLESIQAQQMAGLGEALGQALNESNRRLAAQIENSLIRQVKAPIEEMGRGLDARISHIKSSPQDLALKVIRARQQEGSADVTQEVS